jgi:peptidoglycan/LPS O-acetylase OafA/YrhL
LEGSLQSSMVSTKQKSSKIIEIQILRGWAILIVLITHLSISADLLRFFGIAREFNSGWMGVELFFVISGFVVSKSMFRSGYNFRRFYRHRFFRLIPTLALMLLMALPTVALVTVRWPGSPFSVQSWATYFWDNFWVITGLYNWLASEKIMVLGPMWSLSVEEQFYLLISIIAFLISFCSQNSRIIQTSLAAIAATYIMIYLVTVWMGHHEFLFVKSKFEFICAGVVLDRFLVSYPGLSRRVLSPLAAGRIIWGILITTFLISGFFGHPLGKHQDLLHAVWLPVLLISFSLAVYLAADGATLSSGEAVLQRLLLWLGDRSYVIYIFHFLMFAWIWAVLETLGSSLHYGMTQLTVFALIGLPLCSFIHKKFELPFMRRA